MAEYAGPDTPADAGGDHSADVDGVLAPQRFAVRRMARLLDVSVSGYYAWARRVTAPVPGLREQRRAALAVQIRIIHAASAGTYGSPRVTAELRERGERVSAKTVAAVMAGIGIEGISPRTFKVRTTVADPAAVFPPDLVDRRFDQGRVDAVWLTDVTYLTCGEGDLFWCAIRDGHSRRVLGHVVAERISSAMVAAAVEAAVACRTAEGRTVAGTVLHSDRGGEFTGSLTVQACARSGLQRSMGETGICWDNSPAESFWSTFKHELYYRHTYATRAELVAAVDNWVWRYNHERRHSALRMLPPIRYEQSLTGTANAA